MRISDWSSDVCSSDLPAELDEDVAASREFAHRARPVGEHLVATSGVGAAADRPADMVQHDRPIRKSTRENEHVAQRRMVDPRVETEDEPAQTGGARGKRRVAGTTPTAWRTSQETDQGGKRRVSQ